MTEPNQSDRSIAVIGLGLMGSAMAKNLLADGYVVHGYDPDEQARKNATKMGVRTAPTAADAARDCDIVLTSLPSDSALSVTAEALADESPQIDQKRILVELSTLSIDCKSAARKRLADAGINMLDCPVSGTGAQAQTKDIVLYVSGEEASYETCRPVFGAIARQSFFLGDFGNGMKMKLVANLLVAIHNVATAEALSLARQAGLDPQKVFDVISSGAGSSKIFELRGPMMVAENYEPATMKLDVWQKDMALIRDFAEKVSASTPLFDSTKPLYDKANEAGLGKQDTAAVHAMFKRK